MSTTEKVNNVSKEKVIDIMIESVNDYNSKLMRDGGMSDDMIGASLMSQRPSLQAMFGLIYDELANKDVFK
jgi:hypothetical protein